VSGEPRRKQAHELRGEEAAEFRAWAMKERYATDGVLRPFVEEHTATQVEAEAFLASLHPYPPLPPLPEDEA